MRILLAGASGFIGGALSSSLRSDGHEVVGLGRPSSPGSLATIDVGQRRVDLARVGGDIASFDVVYQLLGAPLSLRRWGAARRESLRSSRIATTELLARTIAKAEGGSPPTFVVGTAIGYYGDRGEELLDESSPGGEGFLADLCRAWEAAANPARSAGARVVTARSGVVLDPGGGALAAQLRIFRLGLGARIGSGEQWLSWIALLDEVRALRFVAEHPDISGPVNLVAPNPVRNREFTQLLARSLDRRARAVAPRALLVGALGRHTAHELLLASDRVLPARLQAAGFHFELEQLEELLRAAVGATGPQ